MSDPFSHRGESIRTALLKMESNAEADNLFPLGYMIPQVEIVLEIAEYDAASVHSDDFDETYWEWLQHSFAEDGMDVDDRERIAELWQQAKEAA